MALIELTHGSALATVDTKKGKAAPVKKPARAASEKEGTRGEKAAAKVAKPKAPKLTAPRAPKSVPKASAPKKLKIGGE